jgi:hypothetical protein
MIIELYIVVFKMVLKYNKENTAFSIDNVHLMYNAHPKHFRHSFWCIDNVHDAN